MTPLLNIPQRMYKESDDHWEEEKKYKVTIQNTRGKQEEKNKIRERTPNFIYSGRMKLQNRFRMKEKAEHVKVVAW